MSTTILMIVNEGERERWEETHVGRGFLPAHNPAKFRKEKGEKRKDALWMTEKQEWLVQNAVLRVWGTIWVLL